MNGDSNGTPDDSDDSADTTIPVEVISGGRDVDNNAAGDAAGNAARDVTGDPAGAAASDAQASAPAEAPALDEVAQLKARIETLESEKKDSWDKLLRTAADLENLRKRQRRELEDARHETKSRVLREMLPVADNLERALAVTAGDVDALLDGVRLVQRQLLQALERLEVTPIEAEHQPFDPNLHEAISQQESEEHPPGTVIAVLQRGYKSGERLLRPSLVVVAKAKAG